MWTPRTFASLALSVDVVFGLLASSAADNRGSNNPCSWTIGAVGISIIMLIAMRADHVFHSFITLMVTMISSVVVSVILATGIGYDNYQGKCMEAFVWTIARSAVYALVVIVLATIKCFHYFNGDTNQEDYDIEEV